MTRPHPTLAVTDSERTLILQRRSGSFLASTTNRRASAYFSDSDCTVDDPRPKPEREATAARTAAAAAATASATTSATSGGSSRLGDRWILEGIRRSYTASRPPPTASAQAAAEAAAATQDDNSRRPQIYYGSVRFPASRVALW